jgi:CRISPR-associated endonuclease/helicase Cas3
VSGERPEEVVAAHHHKAEFEDLATRQLTFLWHAPIVVTTAVQFFETLAGNRPAALRKLHQLPGSAVFIDEAHAALPAHLWPQAWRWLRELKSDWGCHLVLGSGSLNRFWEFEEFSDPPMALPELVADRVKKDVSGYERTRVRYQSKSEPLGLDELGDWIPTVPGPRLLILNTVQSAAVIAAEMNRRLGREAVEHISTSLCPRDRAITLNRVRERLEDSFDDNWTLVATSCVEAGVDLSFRTGLRERSSLCSLIQTGGRVNRKGEYSDAQVWSFQLRYDDFLRPHPAFDTSGRILDELFAEDHVAPEYCTEAMRREVRQGGVKAVCDKILKAESNCQFPTVAEKFKVIDSDTVTALVDRDLALQIDAGETIEPNVLQSLSVQIWRYREIEYGLEPMKRCPDLRIWMLDYNEFLGYMAGVLQVLQHKKCGSIA